MLPSSWIAAGAGAGLGFAAVMVGLSAGAVAAEEIGAPLTPEILQDIARVEDEIDLIEAQTLERLAAPPDNQVQQIELLGKSMLYDKAALGTAQ
jgi:cytochrome c peroxidase